MALIPHSRILHGGKPARHFKPKTKLQRDEVLRKIDIAEAEMEITLMQREQRGGHAVDDGPDPYRMLKFGMLTRPGEYTPECNPPSTVDTIGPSTSRVQMLSLPVIDPQYLDEQLGRDLPVMLSYDFLSGPRGLIWWIKWASVAIGGGLLIAGIIFSTKGYIP